MENFEALQSIDNYCKVLIRKPTDRTLKETNFKEPQRKPLDPSLTAGYSIQPEEPLVDVFDEEDHVRILVQCRCREQQVTLQPSSDGIILCLEERQREKGGSEKYRDVCQKLNIRTDELQLENMLFVIAECNNNNTLRAMIPKLKK